jgi:glycosyltransferase A (GT-A) superfamily protein (DUF2064 family)
MSRAVLIFARSPESEAMAKNLPLQEAVPVIRQHVAEWLSAASMCDAAAVIACVAADREAIAAIVPEQARLWVTQRGTAFGQRLAIAATDAFSLGFSALMIAPIDVPPPAALALAFETVEHGGNVVAPSPNGGVNLLGIRQTDVDLLVSIQPRQRDVVGTLRARFPRLVVLPSAPHASDLAAVCDTVDSPTPARSVASPLSLRTGRVVEEG